MEIRMARVLGEFWLWVSNFCVLLSNSEHQAPLAIKLWVYFLWVPLPRRTSQIYLDSS